MKNKAITIVCVILIIAALICFGYIFFNSGDEDVNPDTGNEPVVEQPEQEPEVEGREEKGQNIIVTSRIGSQLKEIVRLSNMHSNSVIAQLDKDGLTDQTKILFGLDKVFRKEEYMSFAEYSDEFSNTYITAANMHTVIDSTFIDSEITDSGVGDTLPYDEATKCYIVPSIGFSSGTFEYTVEVPYKITEYSDRIELLAYRLYITKTVEMDMESTNIKNEIFYDKEKSFSALVLTDTSLENEANQTNYLKNKIDDKSIDSTSLESVQYTFKVEDSVYKISEFKKI